MKAKEVMEVLQISRQTLYRWRRDGVLPATKLSSGRYDYNDESVYAILNKDVPRGVYLYARVSTPKQKADLKNQMQDLKSFAIANGYVVAGAFQDIASGISFEKRQEFFKLLDLVINHKVSKVIITHKDRLSRVSFEMFKQLFKAYHADIIVLSGIADDETNQDEIVTEIETLLNSFDIKLYSTRRKKIKELLGDQDDASNTETIA